jgi:hypothetical protein
MTNHLFFGLNQPSYYPGKNIDGVIVLHIQTPVKIVKIGVDWEGVEFVSWYQGVSQSENVQDKRTIFKDCSVIEENVDPVELQKGTYAFNVSWPLPTHLPANFEEKANSPTILGNVILPEKGIIPKSLGDEKSYIRYVATTFVDIVNEKDSENQPLIRLERSTPFKIVEQFNPDDLSKPPVEIDNIEKPIFAFGNTIRVRIRIANGGVLFTGQKLYLHVLVENKSNRKVSHITATIFQSVKFNVIKGEPQELLRKEPVLNAIIENSEVGPYGKFDREICIPIPPQLPGTLRNAEFISRKYEISVDVEMPLVTTISVKNPITLLEYSPLLKGVIPEVVNINIHPNDDNGNGGDDDSMDDLTAETTSESSDKEPK